ncbi:MAG: NAD+ synthase [Thermodesulfobacteriota bacterium]
MKTVRIGLAQINSTVGDLTGNADKILTAIENAKALDIDVIAFPEMVMTGYPPEDLLLNPHFIEDNLKSIQKVAKDVVDITAIVGFVDSNGDIFNAAAIIHNRKIIGVYRKMYLPNYGVFDEERYFCAGKKPFIMELSGIRIGISICEDIWYPEGPALAEALKGAEVIININASPFHTGKWRYREKMLATRASDIRVIVAYVNMVGGQDELVFDGHSVIFDEKGDVIARGKSFEEDLIVTDLNVEAVFRGRLHDPRRRKDVVKEYKDRDVEEVRLEISKKKRLKSRLPDREILPPEPLQEIYKALVIGTNDYLGKNGFNKAVIGLSGGIDSALTCTIAVDALGKDNVIGVFMPSPFTSEESEEDAKELAANLGIELIDIPIKESFESYLRCLPKNFSKSNPNEAEENLQARTRGNILMAMSNKFGWLVLTTGNKSETSVGYTTLYGDTAGGFAVIKDVPKTLVYGLVKYRNSQSNSILVPERIITKEPTAELRLGQKDSDSLPPYEILDPILKMYVEEDRDVEEIAAKGFDEETVRQVIRMVDMSEYKRRQAPPGIKITPRAFGKDRRMPITNKYEGYFS